MKPLSKPGPNGGRVYLYRYVYSDVSGEPTFTGRMWAYCLEHLEDKFYSGPDSDGWRLLSAERVKA